MKFADHIRDTSIPEWEDKYLNYKQGKKLIKKYKVFDLDTDDPFINQWLINQEFHKCESFYNEKVDSLLGSSTLYSPGLDSLDI